MIRRVFRLVWRQMNVQLRIRTFNLYSLLLFFVQPAIFSSIGMILSQVAGNEKPDLVYIVVGGGMLGMWSGLVFTSLFDINRDRRDGTLELIVASPTSLGAVEAIRTLTNVLAGSVSMLAAFLVAILIFNYSFLGVNVLEVFVSLVMILFGMWAIGVFLANFSVWSRISGSYVEFLEIPIALICGFMYPIQILPDWIQTISVVIPIRWAVEALNAALLGKESIMFFVKQWGISFILSLLFWRLTCWLERKVHDRIRVSGEMSSI